MTSTVTNLARYPVKGLSPETLASVELRPGRGFAGDRAFALALPDNSFDEAHPEPMPKIRFLMLARQEALARLRTHYDAENGTLTVRDGSDELAADTRTAEGVEAINRFFARFLPDEQRGETPRLVTAPGHCFTDVGVHSGELMHAVSMINLASVRDFEEKLGQPVDPRRFRANILVDGLEPWAELDWVDRELSIGGVALRGARRTVRCPATEVNVETAERDIRLPSELRRLYGHVFLGIYLFVVDGGRIAVGDQLAMAG